MKFKSIVAGLLAANLVVCAAVPAVAAPKYMMPVAARPFEGGRSAQVIVPQTEIMAEANGGTGIVLASALTGGLGAIVAVKVAEGQMSRAQQTAAAIRNGLAGFDIDALAVDSTKATLAANPWLATGEPGLSRKGNWQGLSDLLDANDARQMVFFDYGYVLSADFSSIKIVETIQIAKKDLRSGQKPTSRVHEGNLIYSQTLTSIVLLPNPSKDPTENAARWGADNAALARKALTLGFQGLPGLATTAFDLTPKLDKAMTKRDRPPVDIAGVSGWGQRNTANGRMIYTYRHGLALVRVLD